MAFEKSYTSDVGDVYPSAYHRIDFVKAVDLGASSILISTYKDAASAVVGETIPPKIIQRAYYFAFDKTIALSAFKVAYDHLLANEPEFSGATEV